MNRHPGIKDVAALAGVSIKTVSRVVNGEAAVSPETRERVAAAVEQLGYVPNTAARSLKSGTGDSIGVVIDSLADPFFASVVAAIEARALEEGLSVLVASTGLDRDRERTQLLNLLGGHQVAGVILAPVADEHPYLDAYRAMSPIVAVDRARPYFDSVVVDDCGATKLAVQQLLDHGHRRIGFFDLDPRFSTVIHRYEAYCELLEANGIAVDSELIARPVDGETEHEFEAQRMLGLADPATAFFASNTRASIGLAAALHRLGRQNTAMVAFGDFPLADVLRPSVSAIDHDPALIGNAAIEHLLSVRHAPASGERSERIVPTKLLRRGSSEIPLSTVPTVTGALR